MGAQSTPKGIVLLNVAEFRIHFGVRDRFEPNRSQAANINYLNGKLNFF
jgi:hypothetical protein